MNPRADRIAVFFLLATLAPAADKDPLEGLDALGNICGATHLGFFGDVTTLVVSPHLFHKIGDGPWQTSTIELKGHSVVRTPSGSWIMNDTENHRVIEAEDLSGKGRMVARSELAGLELSRPHDQILDPNSGDIYLIDGHQHLFRFKHLEGPVDVWTFTSEQMGYDRSLSWFDDRLHVIDSSRGEVVRIDSFTGHRFTTFRSPRPNRINPTPFLSYGDRDFMGGSLSATGLILNDVEKVGGWYYGTNEFAPQFALGGDPRPARLIRWRNWVDFEKGKWEDLSSYLPQSETLFTPYFITIRDQVLYSPLFGFRGEVCVEGRILRLDLRSLPK